MLNIRKLNSKPILIYFLVIITLSTVACNRSTDVGQQSQTSVAQTGEWVMEGYSPLRNRTTTAKTTLPLSVQQELAVAGETQFGSPVGIANGRIFIEGDHKLHALDLELGEEAWSFDLPGSFVSPAISGNQVFVRAESGEEGYIFALAADSGLKLWQFKFPRVGSSDGNLGGHATSPVMVDGLVIVGASRAFHALNAETGELVWSFKTDEPISSSASIADELVYFADFENLYALDLKTGQEQWRFSQAGLSLLFAPVIINDQVVTANQNVIYVLDRRTGDALWQKSILDERLIPAGATETHIYIKSVNRIYALDRITGEELWTYGATDFVSLPAITDTLIYVITRTGGQGQLRAIDVTDGNELWRSDDNRLANAAPVIAGTRVYVRTDDGRVLIYN